MNSPDDNSSSRQAGKLVDVLKSRLIELDKVIAEQPHLQAITIVIKLDRRRRPRTVLIRTESKTEILA